MKIISKLDRQNYNKLLKLSSNYWSLKSKGFIVAIDKPNRIWWNIKDELLHDLKEAILNITSGFSSILRVFFDFVFLFMPKVIVVSDEKPIAEEKVVLPEEDLK